MNGKNEVEELFIRRKPVRLLLNIKMGQGPKYVSILAKDTDCTYSHTVKLLDIFKSMNIVDFEKHGRIKYVKLTQDGTEPRLHVIEADVGSERLKFPVGFRVFVGSANQMAAINDLLFVGGYKIGATGEPDAPSLFYVSGDRFGNVAIIRSGTSDRINTLAATAENELLAGCTSGRIYRYNLETGAVSEFIGGLAASQTPMSIAYVDGAYFISTVNGTTSSKVYKTIATGNSKYPTSSTVTGSIWDFGYPEEPKILTEVEMFHEPLAAGESISVEFLLYDDSASGQTTITTDSAGSTMTSDTDNATRKTFTISNAATERTFRFLRPKITLTAGTNQATTPTLTGLTMKCRTTGLIRFFKCEVDLEADTPGQAVTADKRYSVLEDLIENAESLSGTVSKFFSFQVLDPSDKGHPPTNTTTHVVQLEGESTLRRRTASLLLRRVG